MPNTSVWTSAVSLPALDIPMTADTPMTLDKETLKDLDVTESEAANVKAGALSGTPTGPSYQTCLLAR